MLGVVLFIAGGIALFVLGSRPPEPRIRWTRRAAAAATACMALGLVLMISSHQTPGTIFAPPSKQ